MSQKKLLKDNLIVLIGGNIGNVFSFITNFILLAQEDTKLANLYVGYNSIVLILGVPALVSMRMFTMYGNSIISKIHTKFLDNSQLLFSTLLLLLLSIIPATYIISKFTENHDLFMGLLIIILALSTFVVYSFRGLKQFEENYLSTVISLNIETLGRTILVFILGVVFDGGIYGVFVGCIISMLLGIIPCFDIKFFQKDYHFVEEYKLKKAFTHSFVLTLGTEFFSNFDVAYSINVLSNNLQAQTEYNILQIFRKMIFYGLFFTSGLFLSISKKNKFTKTYTFLYTLIVSLGFGILGAIACYFLKDILLIILKKEFIVLTNTDILYFLIFTSLMSASYILSNWLLSLGKNIYALIPFVASIFQAIIFIFSNHDVHSLIFSFSITSGLYFVLCVSVGIFEIYKEKFKKK